MENPALDGEIALPEPLVRAADQLNDMFRRDPTAIGWIIGFHARTNRALVDHPTVQVRKNDDAEEPFFSVGALGIINGLLCKPPYYIVALYDDAGLYLQGFKVARLE